MHVRKNGGTQRVFCDASLTLEKGDVDMRSDVFYFGKVDNVRTVRVYPHSSRGQFSTTWNTISSVLSSQVHTRCT